MGGDHGPGVVVPAALQVLEGQPNVALILVGIESDLRAVLAGAGGTTPTAH